MYLPLRNDRISKAGRGRVGTRSGQPAVERKVQAARTLFTGIDPAKARKPGKVGVSGIEDVPTLHRKDSEMGVGCEIAGRPKTLKLRAKPRKV